MSHVVLRTFLIMIKWGWGKFFPEIGKWRTPTIMDKKATYSNSSLKLWIERKYATDLIQVKSQKKGFVFLVSSDTKRYHKSFPKASKGVFAISLKQILHFILTFIPVFWSQQGL